MQLERDFKGVWIPKEIWLDKNLSAIEKFIFVEIDSLDRGKGCFASNEYISEFCGCSTTTVSNAVSKLSKLGYIYIKKFDGRKRVLGTNFCKAGLQILQGSHTDFESQTYKNCKAIPISNIIYKNNYNTSVDNNLKEFININSSPHFSENQKSCDNPDDLVEIDEEKSVKEKNKKFDQTSDPYLLAKYLEKNIVANNPKFPQTESQKQRWAKDIDKMIRIDKLLPDDIAEVINWCQHDSFWKCNVLSGKKLRDRYQQLRMTMVSRQ